MPNIEARELTGRRADVALLLTNEVQKPFPHFAQKRIDFVFFTLSYKLDPAIGQVLDKSGHVVPASDRKGRVPESNSLDVPGVINSTAMRSAALHNR